MKTIKVKYLLHIFLILGSIVMVFPFVWMILTSVKTIEEIVNIPITILPEKPSLVNYEMALDAVPFLKLYANTLLTMLGRIVCALLFSSMAAYGFARIKFPLRNFFFSIVLLQMMVPTEIFLIPQYMMVSKLGLLNTIPALIFPGLVSAFGTFLLRQQFLSLPIELEEAAIIDGCNRWQIYSKIIVPLSKPSLVSLGVFTALFTWKDLLWPLIVNMNMDKMPLSAGLASLRGIFITNDGVLMAGSVIAIVPMVIIYIICQKQFIEGIAHTGLKG